MEASYLGLLTPAFVDYCTNAGGGQVKLITYSDLPGHEWTCGRVAENTCK